VETTFGQNFIILKKLRETSSKTLSLDLNNAPDIAQTIVVTCFAEGIKCNLQGLHTLKIKETDRLEALEKELTKLGAIISITNNSLYLEKSLRINKNISIKTYEDHRMAMAFTPLSLRVPIIILNAEVVTKSYQQFWSHMKKIGVILKEL
jgi:3-phosphoshikimate 1-carboxyvinyltransferase